MKKVMVEYNSKDWCDADTGEDRDATQNEIAEVFQQWATATSCAIADSPRNSLHYWYCEFLVPDERVEAFSGIFEWTVHFQVTGIDGLPV